MALVVSGCATDVVTVSPNYYLISDPGLGEWFSDSELRTGIIRKATDFCAEQGKPMVPLTGCVGHMAYVHFEHAEMQFQCLEKSELDGRNLAVGSNSGSIDSSGDGCHY